MDTTNLIAWLPFNSSATEDRCGNVWTANGDLSIADAALQLSGNGDANYLECTSIALGGRDFTVHAYCYADSSSPNWARFFSIFKSTAQTSVRISAQATQFEFNGGGVGSISKGTRHHLAFCYQHAARTMHCFVDGAKVGTKSITYAENELNKIWIARSEWSGYSTLIGSVDEFMVHDGVALWTENFTPPTAEDYATATVPFVLTFDVERRVKNPLTTWRYINAGTADTLTVTGTTLTGLPETKSVTGTAFYQTSREKCFDIPATHEIWIKFDVYFDGSARWRAYNGGANGVTGLTAQTNGDLSFFANDSNVQQFSDVCKKNQLQTVLLHMTAGSSDGVIEAWVDGEKIYTYTGDVNHGQDFADIYLQSDGAGTFFSNVVIANRQLTQADGYQSFTADVERKLSNVVEFTADVERYLIKPLIVPFLMGEHFNHYIRSIIVSNSPTTFKLPKKSKVYIHATSPVDTSLRAQWRAVRIFTDTDAAGTVTGDVYATFDECERVSIQSTVSPQSILSDFTWKLRDLGGDKLDAAIEYCTGGLFTTKDELADSFLTDLDNSESNLDFLLRCCGVDLSNDDTGAVVGSDAGGGHPKTTKLIVPEPVPVEEWVVPGSGSSKYIYGLTVYFPTTGANGALTDTEKHILAGLNSVWIYQALWLIDKSCKMEFANLPTQRTRSISVKFVNETNNTLAYVAATYSGNWAIKLELCINMRVYSAIDITSEDGATSNQNDTYLDRTLAHEFTHAVMAAGIGRYSDLPLFIKEGIAEFIHGIDDEKRSSIRHITQPAQRGTLQTIFSTGGTAGDEGVYSAGYLFFRYMVRQTLERGNLPLPPSDTMYNLVISDGAIDYFGRALTDNTRQIFSADVKRTLVKTSENVFDVKFVDTVPVEFTADVSRNILTVLHYFETDNSEYFSGGASVVTLPTQEFIPPMEETGLQSIEITLQEQQLTDQVKVVGVIPFDIMFPVRGQYLDYVYDMRVEKVQQQGILYSADCCIDIDEALYTQFNYSLDSDEDFIYFIPDYETMSLVQVDYNDIDWEELESTNQGLRRGFASKHFAKIANLLGKNYVCQFEDFVSNMQERQSNVTFGDLISQLFGWSSRLPQRMINCYLRDDTLFAVQRGYERNVIDLTNAERTLPTFNRQLMRTFWGSGTSLIEPTTEKETVDNHGSGTSLIEPTTEKETVDNRVTFGGMKVYPWPPTSSPDGKTSYQYRNVSHYPGIDIGYALASTTTRNDDGGKTVVSYGYGVVNNIYTCVSETSTTYDADGKEVDKKTTYHYKLTRSQQFTRVDDEDGNTVGSNVGSNLPGFYNESFWLRLPETVGSEDEIDKITGFNPLVDTEFPVCDPTVYPELINAYIWLNRRTQETVTFSLYNFPHIIDFNDRIVLEGNEYFLVRNTAKTTPRLYNEQNLTLVRWF